MLVKRMSREREAYQSTDLLRASEDPGNTLTDIEPSVACAVHCCSTCISVSASNYVVQVTALLLLNT